MPKKIFDCKNYGDIPYKEKYSFCLDCNRTTLQQLAYYKGDKKQKIKSCTVCGKAYFLSEVIK